ncbi:MAG: hypothetical protein ACPGL0_10715, partial [Limisphaerales bacterium]
LNREFIAGALNGLLWAAVVASAATLWFRDIMIGAIIAAALIAMIAGFPGRDDGNCPWDTRSRISFTKVSAAAAKS